MYNTSQITPFIERVKKEAEEAAKGVYKKYTKEFESRIKKQMKEGQKIQFINGDAFVLEGNKYRGAEYAEDFLTELCMSVFYNTIDCGFDVEKIEK